MELSESSPTQIVFPAITFKEGDAIEPAPSEVELCLCSPMALENGYYLGLEIFDSAGQVFVVRSFRPPPGYRPGASRKPLTVSLVLNPPVAIEFARVRQRIADNIAPERYREDVLQQPDFPHLFRLIASLHPHEI